MKKEILGTIYAMRIQGTSQVKIGFTGGDPLQRLAALQTGQAHQLELIATVGGMTQQTEQQIHRLLTDKRLHGEWFDLKHMDQQSLDDLVVFAFQGELVTAWERGGYAATFARLGKIFGRVPTRYGGLIPAEAFTLEGLHHAFRVLLSMGETINTLGITIANLIHTHEKGEPGRLAMEMHRAKSILLEQEFTRQFCRPGSPANTVAGGDWQDVADHLW